MEIAYKIRAASSRNLQLIDSKCFGLAKDLLIWPPPHRQAMAPTHM